MNELAIDQYALVAHGVAVECNTEDEAKALCERMSRRSEVWHDYWHDRDGKWFYSQYVRLLPDAEIKPEGHPFKIVKQDELACRLHEATLTTYTE